MGWAAQFIGRSPWILAAALASCSADTRLKDLGGATMVFKLSPSTLSLYLFPQKASGDGSGKRDACRKLSTNAKAWFNGQPLKRMTGTYAAGDLTYDRDCILEFAFPGEVLRDRGGPPTEFGGPIPAAARSTAAALIRIEDSSASWTLSLPDAFTLRTLALEAPGSAGQRSIQRGDRVVLRWSPATDVLIAKDLRMRLQQPGHAGEGVIIESDRLTIAADRLSFTVPDNLPERLNGAIELQLLGPSPFIPKLSGCPLPACEAWIDVPVDVVTATLR